MSMIRLAHTVALALLTLAAPALAQSAGDSQPAGDSVPLDAWEVNLAPYFWFVGFEGSVAPNGVTSDFDVGFSDVWDVLEFGSLTSLEARHDRLILSTDVIYFKAAPETTISGLPNAPPVDFHVHAVLDVVVVEGVVGWELVRVPLGDDGRKISLDLRGGFRAWWTETFLRIELDPASPFGPFKREEEESSGWVDPMVGARVRARPTEKLGLVVSGDVGGFDIGSCSKLTWSVAVFATYQVSEHWELGAGWRALDVERGTTDLRISGPLLGVDYRF
jgi:hypothetical protein